MINYPILQKSLTYSLIRVFLKLKEEQDINTIDGIALFLFTGSSAGIEQQLGLPAHGIGMSFNIKYNLVPF